VIAVVLEREEEEESILNGWSRGEIGDFEPEDKETGEPNPLLLGSLLNGFLKIPDPPSPPALIERPLPMSLMPGSLREKGEECSWTLECLNDPGTGWPIGFTT